MRRRQVEIDPLLAWALTTHHCPECGAIGWPVGGGWREMIHMPGCRIGAMPFPEAEERTS